MNREKQGVPIWIPVALFLAIGTKKGIRWIKKNKEDIEFVFTKLPSYFQQALTNLKKYVGNSITEFFLKLGGATEINLLIDGQTISLRVKGKIVSKIPLPEEVTQLRMIDMIENSKGVRTALKFSTQGTQGLETSNVIRDLLYLLQYYSEIVGAYGSLVPKTVLTITITCGKYPNRLAHYFVYSWFEWIYSANSPQNPIKLRLFQDCSFKFSDLDLVEKTVWYSKDPSAITEGTGFLPQKWNTGE